MRLNREEIAVGTTKQEKQLSSQAVERLVEKADRKRDRGKEKEDDEIVTEAGTPLQARSRGEFGWDVVRLGEDNLASMLLVELYSELRAIHGFGNDPLASV